MKTTYIGFEIKVMIKKKLTKIMIIKKVYILLYIVYSTESSRLIGFWE